MPTLGELARISLWPMPIVTDRRAEEQVVGAVVNGLRIDPSCHSPQSGFGMPAATEMPGTHPTGPGRSPGRWRTVLTTECTADVPSGAGQFDTLVLCMAAQGSGTKRTGRVAIMSHRAKDECLTEEADLVSTPPCSPDGHAACRLTCRKQTPGIVGCDLVRGATDLGTLTAARAGSRRPWD